MVMQKLVYKESRYMMSNIIKGLLIVLGLVAVGTTYVVINPEKPEVIKEGYSGTSSKAVATKNEFTGHNKIKVVSPEKPIVLKEGFAKPYEANASGNAKPFPNAGPFKVPDAKPMAKPMLVPDTKAKKKVISIIDTTLEELKAVEADIRKEMK